MRRLLAFFAVALASGSMAGRALAYCQSSTCPPNPEAGIQGAQCQPQQPDDCGTPLKWLRDCVGFAVQQDGSRQIDAATGEKLLGEAFKIWEQADCGMGGPGIHAVDLGLVACDRVEYEPRAGNANILIFRDTGWQENGYDKLALTTVNFDKGTGELWNADIEVNTANYTFKQGKLGGDSNLLGVLTHETGHFLGMAHTPEPTATMFSTYHEGMENLVEDDTIGICSIYPPKNINVNACNPIPRHGFSPLCAADQTEGRCTVAGISGRDIPGEDPTLPLPIPITVALGSVLLLRRRRRLLLLLT